MLREGAERSCSLILLGKRRCWDFMLTKVLSCSNHIGQEEMSKFHVEVEVLRNHARTILDKNNVDIWYWQKVLWDMFGLSCCCGEDRDPNRSLTTFLFYFLRDKAGSDPWRLVSLASGMSHIFFLVLTFLTSMPCSNIVYWLLLTKTGKHYVYSVD